MDYLQRWELGGGRLVRPFFWWNDKPRGGGLNRIIRMQVQPDSGSGHGVDRAVPGSRAVHKATHARAPLA
jgi:hypothetical protein